MPYQAEAFRQLLKELDQLKSKISSMDKVRINNTSATQALTQVRGLYKDLANAVPSGIYRLRVFKEGGIRQDRWASSENIPYKIEFVNDHFCEILKVDKHAFIHNPSILNLLIYEDDRAEFIAKNVKANLQTIPFVWEGRFIIEGKLIWTHFESIPRVLENMDILWTGTLNDITDRKRAEELLQSKNLELQKVNAEKDKFFSIIAHDLKSPFNSIVGFSNILLEKANGDDLGSIQKYAGIINNSAQRAMNLLSNLMQWSLSQTGRMKFNPEHFKMGEIADEILSLSLNIAQQKSITITKEIPSDLVIYADKAMIETVVRNLVSNAIKYTNPGGIIHLWAKVNPNELTVSVSDTGVGIAQPITEKIFRIDSNCSTPDTLGERGTGLGLILCKEFIDQHGGEIWLESEPGKGSVFHFTIPGATNTPMENHVENAKDATGYHPVTSSQ